MFFRSSVSLEEKYVTTKPRFLSHFRDQQLYCIINFYKPEPASSDLAKLIKNNSVIKHLHPQGTVMEGELDMT